MSQRRQIDAGDALLLGGAGAHAYGSTLGMKSELRRSRAVGLQHTANELAREDEKAPAGAHQRYSRTTRDFDSRASWARQEAFRAGRAGRRFKGGGKLAMVAGIGTLATVPRRKINKAINPRALTRFAGRNWSSTVLPTALAGTTAGASVAAERHTGRERSHYAELSGAAAGETAFRGSAHALKLRGHALEARLPEGMSRSQADKRMKAHRKAYNIPGERDAKKAAIRRTPEYSRNYPKEFPAAPYKRVVGHMTGRRGLALETGAMSVGALAGAHAAHRRKTGIGKRLVDEQTRTSKIRATEFGAGAGLLALGGPRLKMIGPASARGVKMAEARGAKGTSTALIQAEAARRAWLTGTQPVIPKLWKPLQSPTIATAAGAGLVAHSIPVRRKTYRPVVMV